MTPQEFIAKWRRASLSERSAYQQHFLDLCDVLGQPKPAAGFVMKLTFCMFGEDFGLLPQTSGLSRVGWEQFLLSA